MSTAQTTARRSRPERSTRGARAALVIGFAALSVALLVATSTPANGVELSIYQSTPVLFWAGSIVALLIGVVVAIKTPGTGRTERAAILLSGTSVFAIVSLPLLRGYYFYGGGDSLSHLGWARMFDAGLLHPVEMRYPGIHTTSVILAKATAIDVRTALLLMVMAFFLVFLLFVPLLVRAITGVRPAIVAGVVSALLLLPINNVGVHVPPYPTTQAIMFAPVVFYLAMAYVADHGERRPVIGDATALGIALGLSIAAVTVIHLQQALNMLAAFFMISLVQYGYREFRSDDLQISKHRPLYAQTGLFALLFLLWSAPQERVRVAIVDIASGLLSGGAPASAVAQRSVSLAVLGGSLEELFVKLFGVSLVYSILAAVLGLAVLGGSVSRVNRDGNAVLKYLIAAAVPAAGLFLVFLLADAKTQYFRYFGYVMATVTVLGAVALAIGLDRLGDMRARPALSTIVGLAFAVFLVMQLLSFHPSPYIYQPNPHISEAQMDGYNTALADRDEEIVFRGIRSGPRRYVDAYYGTQTQVAEEFPGRRKAVPEAEFNQGELGDYYDHRAYLPVTESDQKREIELYDGFRYSEEGFDHLDSSTEIDRVHANDEFQLYLIDPAEE